MTNKKQQNVNIGQREGGKAALPQIFLSVLSAILTKWSTFLVIFHTKSLISPCAFDHKLPHKQENDVHIVTNNFSGF